MNLRFRNQSISVTNLKAMNLLLIYVPISTELVGDFTAIDGLGILTVQTIISEVGLDPTRFPTVKHFTSWLGLCPCNRITGGKVKSSQTRLVVNPAANAFRMAAQTAGKKSNSALGAFYRRLRSRLGTPKLSLLLLISWHEFLPTLDNWR
ncbi:MAG: hypothetical protein N4J56_007283 [Chroococcidiopsis sp. SAG 2025]|nr:hypothetical protein [Chroococcidiopsis sp. SAG 2025]